MKLVFLTILAFVLAEKAVSQEIQLEANRFLKVKQRSYGVTDSLDQTVVPFIYELIEYKNNRLIVYKKGLTGLLTLNNEVVLTTDFKFILPRNNNRFILWTPNSQFGLCNQDGQIILPVSYKSVSSTENDDYYITKNEKNLNGVYSFTGEQILPEVYRFYTQDGYKVFAVKDDLPLLLHLQQPDSIVVLDKDIAFVETVRHNSMGEQFFQIVKKGNKYGVLNTSNEIVIPLLYDEVKSSQNWRYYICKINGKLGIIKVDGTVVKELIYDSIELRKEYVLLKQKHQTVETWFYE